MEWEILKKIPEKVQSLCALSAVRRVFLGKVSLMAGLRVWAPTGLSEPYNVVFVVKEKSIPINIFTLISDLRLPREGVV